MSNRISSEEFVALANQIINDPNPIERIGLAKDLADPLGMLLMMPTPVLEQLLVKLQLDCKTMQEPPRHPDNPLVVIAQMMLPKSLATAKYTIGVLIAWTKVRADFVKAMLEFGLPEKGIPE